MMNTTLLARRFALVTGAVAIVGMGALSACATEKEKPAETTKSQESSAPATPSNAPAPTEKAVGPGGNNSFSPTYKAPAAPSLRPVPGNVIPVQPN
jgi:hypothetical protein